MTEYSSSRLRGGTALATVCLGFLFFLSFSGCLKEDFSDISVNYTGTLAIPIGTIGFTLAEALDGTDVLTLDPDNSIRLSVREDSIFHIRAADLLDELTGDIDASFSQTTAIGKVRIPDITQQFSVPFSTVVNDFPDMSLRQLLLANDGGSAPLPSFQQNLSSDLAVLAFDDFTWVDIDSGILELSVHNGLFLDLENVGAIVRDAASGTVIADIQFPAIPVNTTQSQVIQLTDLTIGNSFQVSLQSIGSPGTGGAFVPIDLSKELDFTMVLQEVSVTGGQAKLASGTLAVDTFSFDLTLDNGERLYQALVEDVGVDLTLSSSVQTGIKLRLNFPTVRKNNLPVTEEILLPTTLPGPALTVSPDFSATTWSFDQDPAQPYNRLPISYEVILENPTGGQVVFSAQDKVEVGIQVTGFQVEQVSGYFGKREEIIDAGTIDLGFDFTVFDPASSPLFFEDPVMRLELDNSFGIPFSADFDIEATGAFGAQAALQPPLFVLDYPALSEIGQSVRTDYVLDKSNSNLVNLLSVYPTLLAYGGTVSVNPDDDLSVVNFLRKDSRLVASAAFDLPFRFKVDQLVYRDTGETVSLSLDEGLTVDDIREARLKILYRNGLPLRLEVRLVALSSDGTETLVTDDIRLDAAAVDAEGKVTPDGAADDIVEVSLQTDQLRLLDGADKLVYEIKSGTGADGTLPAWMFTDYEVEIKAGLSVTFDRR
ncbi:MAG: hypothetical protein RLY31_204 [Bacteroidota bacterium]|jgi:hypothetical protein